MLMLSPKDEFDKEYGELYVKGFLSEENYMVAKRQFYRQIHLYRKPLTFPSTQERFSDKIKGVFHGIASLCRTLWKKVC